ncbi:MAG: fatty acyl-AMP ligase [Chromatiales bacterium]|jgi:fatty-acyl-CoA synthase
MTLEQTPTLNDLPLRLADFETLAEALDYAAHGVTGLNYYDGRLSRYAVRPYVQLRMHARSLARRLRRLELERGARVAVIAETGPDFAELFFACQYAGLVPVPMPVPTQLGAHRAYVEHLRGLVRSCKASVAIAPSGCLGYLEEACAGLDLRFVGDVRRFTETYGDCIEVLEPAGPDELAYIQYTSGSTRFPRGVMVTQRQLMSNLAGILREGVAMRRDDRCVSWLPYYHDMGLVGMLLAPMAAQISVDYLGTREFAMRPRQWLSLISRSGATISFAPPFAYELCTRRLRAGDAEQLDLSRWRVAGVGAEMIRPQALDAFAQALRPAGFDPGALLASYGMAECGLAISFAPLGQGIAVDHVQQAHLERFRYALRAGWLRRMNPYIRTKPLVDCGRALSSLEVEIRDEQGRVLPSRQVGIVHVRGPSVMAGYFDEPSATAEALTGDGWLNTGDLGYLSDGRLVITGRQKDLIIVNGRNIWPQDLEQIAEAQPGVRPGDAAAFAVPDTEEGDVPVLLLQTRETDAQRRQGLIEQLQASLGSELGVRCRVALAAPHSLPRTTSGKPSRAQARELYARLDALEPAAGEGTDSRERAAL